MVQKNKVKKGDAPENVEELFQTVNINADYSFYNFDKQKKLVNFLKMVSAQNIANLIIFCTTNITIISNF